MATADQPHGIVWESLEFVYPGAEPVVALHPTDLRLELGEQVAVIGPSGSGKSTALNVLGLLDRPTAGSYSLFGRETTSMTEFERAGMRSREIGFVFQRFHVLPRRTAVENVMLGMLYGPVGRRDRRERALQALHQVGMDHRAHALAATLSGGELQRVAVARSLCHSPRLLLADEPTGNLDQRTGEDLLELLESLVSPGLLQVIVTHDPSVAARCGRVVEIVDGKACQR